MTAIEITNPEIRQVAMNLAAGGVPERVIVSADGHCVPAWRARQMGVSYDLVLVRNDGWTLGTTHGLASAARELWAGFWVAEIEV